MASTNSTAVTSRPRSTRKIPPIPLTPNTDGVKSAPTVREPVGVIEQLEPSVRRLVVRALKALEASAVYRVTPLNSPTAVRDFLKLRLADLDHEVFIALWLDSQNQLIACETCCEGTLTQTSIYPREIVKAGLRRNAGAVIFAHNHPSGISEPSRADELLTRTLRNALSVVDIKVLDHLIVGGIERPFSFAEHGLI